MDFSPIIDTADCCDNANPVNLKDCHAVQRIAVILACYKDWCQNAADNMTNIINEHKHDDDDDDDDNEDDMDESDGFYCFMHEALNYAKDETFVYVKLLNDYNHLLLHHNSRDDFESLYSFFIEHVYDKKGCTLNECEMLERNNRDRNELSKQENKRRRLYHGYITNKEISIQQTVDRIHCQYLHSYDLGYKLTRNEREYVENIEIEIEEKELNENDEDSLLNTRRLRKISQILTEKRERDSRGRDGRNNSNKFTTIISNDKQQIDIMAQNDDIDDDEEEDEDIKSNDNDINKKNKDVPSNNNNNKSHKNVVLRPGINQGAGPEGAQYSFGYRYYYWKHYIQTEQIESLKTSTIHTLPGLDDDKKEDEDVINKKIRHEIEPGNNGYETWDWFIPKKYCDLKTEITQNTCCVIGIQQWEDCKVKAEGFLYSDDIGKKMKSYGEWIYKYDINDDEPIKLEHIITLLLYCNYDVLQAEFSATFRRLENETNENMIKRHREFANWGRILRETVELYGDNIRGQYTDINNGEIKINQNIHRLKFYHGINCELLFPRTIARFNGPTSTTTTIAVAMAFTNAKGLCLQLIRKDPEYKHCSFFNCVLISDFSYEEERFFIGGLEPLQISTIIDVATNINYRIYIKSLNNIQNFIEGTNNGWAIHRVTNTMKKYISLMFSNYGRRRIGKYDIDDTLCKIPEYILNLFRSYANSVTKIDLNLEAINSEKSVQGKFGFKIIRNLIMIELNDEDGIGINKNDDNPNNRQWVKMDTVGNIFRKCQELHIRSGFSINMIKLNRELMDDLVGFIQSNNVIERFQQLTKINIYNVDQSEMKLIKAVKNYKKNCYKHGWNLSYQIKTNPTIKILKLDRNRKKNNDKNNNNNNDKSFMSKLKNKIVKK